MAAKPLYKGSLSLKPRSETILKIAMFDKGKRKSIVVREKREETNRMEETM